MKANIIFQKDFFLKFKEISVFGEPFFGPINFKGISLLPSKAISFFCKNREKLNLKNFFYSGFLNAY